MKEYEVFAKRLKFMMKTRSTTNKELANKIGVTEATISRYLKGDRIPRGTEIAAIAKEFDVSSDYLLGLDDDFNSKNKGTICTDKLLKLCEREANNWKDFQLKALDNIGKGDSFGHSFSAVAFGAEQERMYGWEIPNLVRRLSNTKEI